MIIIVLLLIKHLRDKKKKNVKLHWLYVWWNTKYFTFYSKCCGHVNGPLYTQSKNNKKKKKIVTHFSKCIRVVQYNNSLSIFTEFWLPRNAPRKNIDGIKELHAAPDVLSK